MVKKVLVTLIAFVVVGICAFGGGLVADSSVGLPEPIVADSKCPAVGCASGSCHGFGDIPQPDGIHEMDCPESDCSSVECHAWDTLQSRYHQASDASMNLWIVAPVALVIILVLMARKL